MAGDAVLSFSSALVVIGAVVALVAGARAWLDIRSGNSRGRCLIDLCLALGGIVLAIIPPFMDGESSESLEILEPAGGTERVPWCSTLRVGGSVPTGQALVIANSERDDSRWYFEAAVERVPDRDEWRATVHLGDQEENTTNRAFKIYAVVMDEDLATYLSQTTPEANATYWSSPADRLPPGAKIVDDVDVRRNDNPSLTCEG
jgi:hypothetical protein